MSKEEKLVLVCPRCGESYPEDCDCEEAEQLYNYDDYKPE